MLSDKLIAQGRAEGEAKGRAEAQAQAQALKDEEIIKMHKEDIAIDIIARVKGVTAEYICDILQKNGLG